MTRFTGESTANTLLRHLNQSQVTVMLLLVLLKRTKLWVIYGLHSALFNVVLLVLVCFDSGITYNHDLSYNTPYYENGTYRTRNAHDMCQLLDLMREVSAAFAEYLPTASDMNWDIKPLQDVQLHVMKQFTSSMNGSFMENCHEHWSAYYRRG